MKVEEMIEFQSWKAKNLDTRFSLYDYVYGVMLTNNIHVDLLVAVGRLFWPPFIKIDSLIFLEEQYSPEAYAKEVALGRAGDDIEYFTNMLSLDGFVGNLTGATSLYEEEIANIMLKSWSAKLAHEFPDRPSRVLIAEDEAVGDYCITFVGVSGSSIGISG